MYLDISARFSKDVNSMEISKATIFSNIKLLKLISIIKNYAFQNPLQVIYTKHCSKVQSTADTRLQTVIRLFCYVLDSLQTSFHCRVFLHLTTNFGERFCHTFMQIYFTINTDMLWNCQWLSFPLADMSHIVLWYYC